MNNGRGTKATRVSIGLPVYNGDNYLREALDSLLAQSFGDFELIITDNASTDETESICEDYAKKDARIRYVRNRTNIGAAANYNLAFELSDGKYFKWAAHDDVCSPGFLKSAVEALDSDPSIVLCHPKEIAIDNTGATIPGYMNRYEVLKDSGSESPHKRLHDIACKRHLCFQVFGLVRAAALASTTGIASYVGSDRVLLSELVLMGRFYEVADAIYFRRHSEQFCAIKTHDSRISWLDPENKSLVENASSKILLEYIRALSRSRLALADKAMCYLILSDYIRRKRRMLLREALVTAKVGLRGWSGRGNARFQ